MNTINISVPFPLILRAIENLPIRDKHRLADKLEKDLLAEFDEYDNSSEVRKSIEISMKEYKKGNFRTLDELKRK